MLYTINQTHDTLCHWLKKVTAGFTYWPCKSMMEMHWMAMQMGT